MLNKQYTNSLLLLVFFVLHTRAYAQQGRESILFDNFDTLKYDKVIAFNYNYDSILNKKTWHDRSMTLEKRPFNAIKKTYSKTLNKKQIQKLTATITDTATYGLQHADCFDPRFGIAFMKGSTPVFVVEICFDCGYLETSIPLKAARQHYYELDISDENDKPIVYRKYLKGFTKVGGQKLVELCQELNLGYCYSENEYHAIGE